MDVDGKLKAVFSSSASPSLKEEGAVHENGRSNASCRSDPMWNQDKQSFRMSITQNFVWITLI